MTETITVDPSTIQNKLLVGYRGWFVCPRDGKETGYRGWFNGSTKQGLRPNMDILPDTSMYDPSERYAAPGLKTGSGEECYLFSSRNQKTVDRHFEWMAQYGVDGAFLHKPIIGTSRIPKEVGCNVEKAAGKTGRVFAITYDVSGVQRKQSEIQNIVPDCELFRSSSYLREKGQPVVALSGFEFGVSGREYKFVRSIAARIRSVYPDGVYLIGVVPSDWRTPTNNTSMNNKFSSVCLNFFDAISPWTVGAFDPFEEAERSTQNRMKGDLELITMHNDNREAQNHAKLDYIPVVFPWSSRHNSSDGKWDFNHLPRDGGQFLSRQIHNATALGAKTIYAATWDGYDDGTALMPIISRQSMVPQPVVCFPKKELSLPVIIAHEGQLPLIFALGDRKYVLCKHSPAAIFRIDSINIVVLTTDEYQKLNKCDPWPFVLSYKDRPPPTPSVPSAEGPLVDLPRYINSIKSISLPVPTLYKFLAPDTMGYDVPGPVPYDLYMKICGDAAQDLHRTRQLLEGSPQTVPEDPPQAISEDSPQAVPEDYNSTTRTPDEGSDGQGVKRGPSTKKHSKLRVVLSQFRKASKLAT